MVNCTNITSPGHDAEELCKHQQRSQITAKAPASENKYLQAQLMILKLHTNISV
jgi:hypothetical protein